MRAGETWPDYFYIQAGLPSTLGERDDYDGETLPGAVETVFPRLYTEDILVRWADHFFTLNYKYTFSYMIDSLLELLRGLRAEEGELTVQWSPQEFFERWRLRWWSHGGLLVEWLDTERFPPLQLTKTQFMAEWKRPLTVCRDALAAAGYGSRQIAEFATLEDELRGLEDGLLYRGLSNSWPVDGSPPQLPPGFR